MIQFAYATNMNVKNFTEAFASAQKIGNAYLPGYEFAFNFTAEDLSSKGNVMAAVNPDMPVWGILVELSEDDAKALDEGGWTETLEPKYVPCIDEAGNLYNARVFTALPHAVSDHLLPYDWYKEKILTLATMHGLPENYIAWLNLLPAKPDPDEARKERRMKKFRNSLPPDPLKGEK